MADRWDKAGVVANLIVAAVAVATLCIVYAQLRDAKEALNATTLYNVEKDYQHIFEPVSTDNFQKCFGNQTDHQPLLPLPNPCEDNKERGHLFYMLDYYRLLL